MDKSKEALARLLNGREYVSEITEEEEAAAKSCGLVVLFGASDDLAEFRGAINDEAYCGEGTQILIDREGILPDRDSIDDDDELEKYFPRARAAAVITTKWDCNGYSWMYATEIPHASFDIVEDDTKYCRGIVFELASLP